MITRMDDTVVTWEWACKGTPRFLTEMTYT